MGKITQDNEIDLNRSTRNPAPFFLDKVKIGCIVSHGSGYCQNSREFLLLFQCLKVAGTSWKKALQVKVQQHHLNQVRTRLAPHRDGIKVMIKGPAGL